MAAVTFAEPRSQLDPGEEVSSRKPALALLRSRTAKFDGLYERLRTRKPPEVAEPDCVADLPEAKSGAHSGPLSLRDDAMTVIGCSIFRKEIENVLGQDFSVVWLPAGLHVSDARLGEALAEHLGNEGHLACLYGACHPDLDSWLAKRGDRRLQARNCIEAFLSPAERARFGDRAFIMTPGWLREWRSIFVEGLGWDEVDGRQNFGIYDRIVLLDFGLEPIDDYAVLEFSDYAQTPVDIVPATLDFFREKLRELLEGQQSGTSPSVVAEEGRRRGRITSVGSDLPPFASPTFDYFQNPRLDRVAQGCDDLAFSETPPTVPAHGFCTAKDRRLLSALAQDLSSTDHWEH